MWPHCMQGIATKVYLVADSADPGLNITFWIVVQANAQQGFPFRLSLDGARVSSQQVRLRTTAAQRRCCSHAVDRSSAM